MKYLLVLIIATMVTGCSLDPSNNVEMSLKLRFTTINEAFNWTHDNIKWVSDQDNYGRQGYWASPEQTFNKKSGDCEDQCLLFMKIVYDNFNKKLEMRGTTEHWVAYDNSNNIYYDVVNGKKSSNYPDIIKTYSYDVAMLKATTTH
jgi:hypothetical protein